MIAYTVPEAERSQLPFGAPYGIEVLNLPEGPRPLPRWATGGHIEWHWPFSNRPSFKVRCAHDPLDFTTSGAPVWRMFEWHDGKKKGRGWIAEREGVAACHYHDGTISMQEFEERVRWVVNPCQANNWKGEAETRKYQMLATSKQEGYAGRHFDITLAAQHIPIYSREHGTVLTKVEHGTKLRLQGPWHGGAPSGYLETSYWIDDEKAWKPKDRKWFESSGYFGLYIKPELLLDIMATYQSHVPWARVTETRGNEDCVRLEPLIPEVGLPKRWLVHPDQCPGHEYVLSPFATGRDRRHPNDSCRFCGTKRQPGWVYVSSFDGKPIPATKREEPLYFDRYLTPPPPRAPSVEMRWPADVAVPLRSIAGAA